MNLEKIYEDISNEIKAMTDDEIKEVSEILRESNLVNANHSSLKSIKVDTKSSYKVEEYEYNVMEKNKNERPNIENHDVNQVKNNNIIIAA
ncbi:hypothetical protein ACWEXW_09255 [Staphylococcus xylosus]|uniref:hypothetical protein n=1 Tax=Staphylococcus xylosus TaxID=1288 RepID=UPI000D1D1C71|nr:hypothetical protein [Staphylococcus xylosus]MDW4124421.1 hypothetical protein [Staphylococcus saprophyticus]MDW4516704.1 hypothetical protein [Staphylococcus saprophyticus]PTH92063.1 hypothetical protein BU118_12315 [Staphylococcus xylosus]QDW89741.1 hypothetical protein DWB98_09960 [Staphylococcus xylosus]